MKKYKKMEFFECYMKAHEFLTVLKSSKSAIFTVNDAARILKKNSGYSRLYLHRLKNRKMLFEVERGKYTLYNHPFVVASNMIFPAYVSFLAALSYHGLTTQAPRQLHVVSLRARNPLAYRGAMIRFVSFSPKRFFGYKREGLGGSFAFVAEPEKAIVDSLFMPRYCPISESFGAIASKKISAELIASYGLRMGSGVVAKRLGYMLDAAGLGDHHTLRATQSNRMDPLNPNLPLRGERNRKWKLIINERLEA